MIVCFVLFLVCNVDFWWVGLVNVWIGFVFVKVFVSVLYCIVYLLWVSGEDVVELLKKGVVGEGWVLIVILFGWLLINCINESRFNEVWGVVFVCILFMFCFYINIFIERNDFLGI